MLSAHAAGNRVPCGDRLVVHETSTGGVEALRLTALTDGKGVIEYFETPECFWRQFLDGPQDGDVAQSHGEPLRRFEGLFKKGFPTIGSLLTRTEAGTEYFEQVHFDGATHAGDLIGPSVNCNRSFSKLTVTSVLVPRDRDLGRV
jgi:hypothetical protein